MTWKIAVCTRCNKLLAPEVSESGWCHCELEDFDNKRPTYRVVEVEEVKVKGPGDQPVGTIE